MPGGIPLTFGCRHRSIVARTFPAVVGISVLFASMTLMPPPRVYAAATGSGLSVATKTAEAPGTYQPVTPLRLLDTRTGNGVPKARVAAGGAVTLQITGRGGVPVGVSAAVAAVTVVGPAGSGTLVAAASGNPTGRATIVNFPARQGITNTVVLPVGTDGKVVFTNTSGATIDLVADLAGYFVSGTPTAAGAYAAVTPLRLLDTRTGNGAPKARVAAGGAVTLQITGRGGVPVGVSAAVAAVTVVGPAGSGTLVAAASGNPTGRATIVNFPARQGITNTVVLPVGTDGKVVFTNTSGATIDLVADLAGYFVSGTPTAAGAYAAVTPLRLLDTRTGNGAPKARVAAASGNPTGRATIVNFPARQGITNTVVLPVGTDGKVVFTNTSGATIDLVADLTGYDSAGIRGAATNVVRWGPSGAAGMATYGTTETVSGLSRGIKSIKYNLALAVDGTVWSLSRPGESQAPPKQISGLGNIVSLASNGADSYALKADGTVWSWGYNLDGELGIGNTGPMTGIVEVSGLTDIVAVAQGGDHAYALKADGTVWRCGTDVFGNGPGNTFGQYGDLPVQVPGLAHVTGIGGSGQDGYAITADGALWAWGAGFDGELGNGQIATNSDAPVQVQGLTDVVAIADNTGYTTYALTSAGQVWAWGQNLDGELGSGPSSWVADIPIRIPGIEDAIAISGHYALTSHGTVLAWAVANQPPLSDGTVVGPTFTTPVAITNLQHATSIASFAAHGWALIG